MDDWKKFNETLLSRIKDFYSQLYMDDITDADYAHAKRVFKEFEIKKLEEYHDFCVQSDTYLTNFEICVLKYMSLMLQNFFQLLN